MIEFDSKGNYEERTKDVIAGFRRLIHDDQYDEVLGQACEYLHDLLTNDLPKVKRLRNDGLIHKYIAIYEDILEDCEDEFRDLICKARKVK